MCALLGLLRLLSAIKNGANGTAITSNQKNHAQIYSFSKELISVFTKDPVTKFLVKQAVEQLNTVSFTVEQLRLEMNRLAAQLPEYQVVMAMKGVGPSLGPQLMAEICDLSRFSHREALTAFAGVDPGVNQSGTYEARSVRTSKRGSPQLRKTLFIAFWTRNVQKGSRTMST